VLALDGVAGIGPGRCCSPCHRMPKRGQPGFNLHRFTEVHGGPAREPPGAVRAHQVLRALQAQVQPLHQQVVLALPRHPPAETAFRLIAGLSAESNLGGVQEWAPILPESI